VNYLAVCRRALQPGDTTARQALEGIQAVLAGTKAQVLFEYPCPAPAAPRWFLARITPLHGPGGGVVVTYSDITTRKRVELELAEQRQFEAFLAEISALFVRVAAQEIEAHLTPALERLGTFFGVDHVALFQRTATPDDLCLTHAWCADGIATVPLTSLKHAVPWATQHVLAGQLFAFAQVDELPTAATREKAWVQRSGMQAHLTMPLCGAGTIVGALALSSMRQPRSWPPALVARLRLLGDTLVNALLRTRAAGELRHAVTERGRLHDRLQAEPFDVQRASRLQQTHNVRGESPAIKRVLRLVEQVAPTDATVLLLGETGTGKELLAAAIHARSPRSTRTMVQVNCAALPAALIESELFGREKGAYTGALSRQEGRFEVAHDSTLFLDEIGELPLDLQAKLLRVLQDGQFERLGSPTTRRVNVRIIAATNRDLAQAVQAGRFREDLYYRLQVFPILVPPLRARQEDIPLLVWAFVQEFSRRMGKTIDAIPRSTMQALQSYPWPGNVRELRNVIERAMILSADATLRVEVPVGGGATALTHQSLAAIERRHIGEVLAQTGWRIRGKGGAAELLGLKPTTLEARMQKLGLQRRRLPLSSASSGMVNV
jgi:transcriptional regulator with GAF, ATPase, and Fis domain